jgi:hypothetical protein
MTPVPSNDSTSSDSSSSESTSAEPAQTTNQVVHQPAPTGIPAPDVIPARPSDNTMVRGQDLTDMETKRLR